MSDTFYIITIVELLFICSFCCFMVYRLKQRLGRLAKRLNPNTALGPEETLADSGVIAYFIGQHKRTRALADTELGQELKLSSLFTSVRCAYINAERRALKSPENSKAYWLTLKDEITKLIGILSSEAKRTGMENTELREKLKLFRERLEKVGDKAWLDNEPNETPPIEKPLGYLLKFSRGLTASSQSAHCATNSGATLLDRLDCQKKHTQSIRDLIFEEKNRGNIENRINEYEKLIYKMEHDSANIHKLLKESQKKLSLVDQAFTTNAPKEKQKEIQLSVIRANKEPSNKGENIFDDLMTDAQDLGIRSKQSIDSLQKTILNQRKSILSMENAISSLESEKNDSSSKFSDKHRELDQLKKTLIESEGCIKILESEVENLYSHLRQLQEQRINLKDNFKAKSDLEVFESIEQNRDQIQLESSVEHLTKGSLNADFLTKFMTSAVESKSQEDLLTVLQHNIRELGFESMIRLLVRDNKIDISSMGKTAKEFKLLLERIEFSPAEEIQISNKYTTVHCRNIRAILAPIGSKKKLTEPERLYLKTLFNFTSILSDKVAAQQDTSARLDSYEYFNEKLQSIDVHIQSQDRYQKTETEAIIQSIMDQSEMLIGEKATAGQVLVLKAMESEINQRLDLLEANRKIVRKQFSTMMAKLRSI